MSTPVHSCVWTSGSNTFVMNENWSLHAFLVSCTHKDFSQWWSMLKWIWWKTEFKTTRLRRNWYPWYQLKAPNSHPWVLIENSIRHKTSRSRLLPYFTPRLEHSNTYAIHREECTSMTQYVPILHYITTRCTRAHIFLHFVCGQYSCTCNSQGIDDTKSQYQQDFKDALLTTREQPSTFLQIHTLTSHVHHPLWLLSFLQMHCTR